ncbi:MAG: LD-carboxypeptidase [Bacteroidales bacterium]|jgi:muramoyltetrapeptide carboxypeptidase|nr:LD-carboxypeptidase [Bacteroidales bacterium]
MITPSKLKKGNKIGIIAPARKIQMTEIEAAIKVFEQWGLEVVLGKNVFAQHRQFAGTVEQRSEDLQYMLDDTDIKAIVCARGGYGTVKILKYLDFSKFLLNPKWLVGYSDITALHAHLNQNLGVKSIHGVMPFNFPKDATENEAIKTLKNSLFGEQNIYKVVSHDFNRQGKVSGELIGGNLSVLFSVSGTKYDIETSGKILVLEDLEEYLYHIDRMMMNMKHGGKLENLKGLIVGGMTDMNDNQIPFGKSAYEIICEAVEEYDFPVCYNFPVGHIEKNYALILGAHIELEVRLDEVIFRD